MSRRLKILSCGAVERIKGDMLNEVQVQVVDRVTGKEYNIECYLISNEVNGDYYRIEVYSIPNNELVDVCTLDSSGGVFMDDDFSCDVIDDELGVEITTLFVDYFIVPF